MGRLTDREAFTTNHAISGFLITLGLSFITLLLILYDKNILVRFAAFTPTLKSDPYILAWVVLAFLVSVFVALGYVVITILDEINVLRDFIWYLVIHLGTLFLSTLAFKVLDQIFSQSIILIIFPAILGNTAAPPLAYFYFVDHFKERYNLVPFIVGITVLCLAYTWLYLFLINAI